MACLLMIFAPEDPMQTTAPASAGSSAKIFIQTGSEWMVATVKRPQALQSLIFYDVYAALSASSAFQKEDHLIYGVYKPIGWRGFAENLF